MHLDLGIREVPIEKLDEIIEEPAINGARASRIRVGVVAADRNELKSFEHYLGKIRKEGLVSTDGRGQPMNKWKVLNIIPRFKEGLSSEKVGLVLELEEFL